VPVPKSKTRRHALVVSSWLSGAFGEAGSPLAGYNSRMLFRLLMPYCELYPNGDKPAPALAPRFSLGRHYHDWPDD
jgi:hypothetical protein